jgi:hypothetical protein
VVVGAFLLTYARQAGVGRRVFLQKWPLGIAGAITFGAFVVWNIYSQPASAVPSGAMLIWSLVWFGLFYGLIDALFLNVFPVLLFQSANHGEVRRGRRNLVITGVAALATSILIAAAYHLGFTEYRGAALLAPLFGNAVLTLSYLVTRSPLAPIGAHVAMHMAGVLRGMETVAQLPPHY